jgi:cation diffusion facilitator CzcD-associated flavoprotein CzcO
MVPDSESIVMHNSRVAKYLNENVDHFKLRDKIRFETTVVSVKPIENDTDNVSREILVCYIYILKLNFHYYT